MQDYIAMALAEEEEQRVAADREAGESIEDHELTTEHLVQNKFAELWENRSRL